jgi:hypothetical protein
MRQIALLMVITSILSNFGEKYHFQSTPTPTLDVTLR